MNFSPEQERALAAVKEWFDDPFRKPYFYLAGYAGTGKTTLAKHFAQDHRVAFGAFTGKAASVMRAKGCRDAKTIHSLIYAPTFKSELKLQTLQDKLDKEEDETQRAALRIQIREEQDRLKNPSFEKRDVTGIDDADLVIIDECSMVDKRMGMDLLSYEKPILVLGDPAQLPPVGSSGFFTGGEPDFMLTQVHRQAAESGILQLATRIREGKELDFGTFGNATVMRRGELDPSDVPGYDQILVGRNATRHATNNRMRELLGRASPFPEADERLVCLRNNKEFGLLNGEIYYTAEPAQGEGSDVLLLDITDEARQRRMSIAAWTDFFTVVKPNIEWPTIQQAQQFTYGYVLTTHKAQGSEWPRVIVFDESSTFRADAQRWLYTAVTRASEQLTLIRN